MHTKPQTEYLTENELKIQLKSGVFAPCYLLFGEEHYLIKTYVDRMVNTAVENFKEFNISRFDGKTPIQNVYDAVYGFPMMSPKRIVTLCDYPFDKVPVAESEKLLALLDGMPATTVFVIWYETVDINSKKPGDKFQKLIKGVQSIGGQVCILDRKPQDEIMKMLQAGAAKRRCRMDISTARYMTEVCSDNLGILINELEKLCMYVGENGTITDQTVDKVCSRSVEASVYNVSKAVLRGNLSGAYKLLDDLFYMNTEPSYILTFLASAYIDIYRAFAARSNGINPQEIAKEFGYGNRAFVLTEAERNMKKLSERQIVDSLKVLSECDQKIKGSRMDGKIALEKVLAELMQIARSDNK